MELKELVKNIAREYLKEAEYNYHRGKLDLKDIKPYGSDSKYAMVGRDTGHFGSGLYFSTYKCDDSRSNIDDDGSNSYSEIVEINDGVYRVDMDIYKNLYRASTKNQAEALFKSLKLVNSLYNSVSNYYKYNHNLPNNFSNDYLICHNNFKYLGLKLPEYKLFLRMCKEHYNSGKNKPQSMSTVIMEYNGFNGVNVSGVYGYDNTTHGSVIYDLSKTDTNFRKVDVDSSCKVERGKDNTYVSGGYFDFKSKLMRGEDVINSYVDEFNKLSNDEQVLAIKRYGYFLRDSILDKINPNIKRLYYQTLGSKIKKGIIDVEPDSFVISSLISNNMFKIINDPTIIFPSGKSLLLVALKSRLNYSDEEKLLNNINRPLSSEEEKAVDWLK